MAFLLRWAATFLAFPLGGFLVLPLTPVQSPLAGAAVGLATGAVLGLAQWWALRGKADWRWAAVTTAAMTIGTAAAAAVTGGPVSTGSAVATGLIAGAAVGAAQGVVLRRGIAVAIAWAGTVSLSWGLGWFLTANVITDVRDGFAIFGASGAAVVTLLTGVALVAVFRFRSVPAGRLVVTTPAPAATPAR
jgi:hypothetical protein